MKKLNILLSTNEYPPYPLGGSGMFALNLSESIREHNITIITSWIKGEKELEKRGNITIIRLKNPVSKFISRISSKMENRNLIDRRILFGLSLRKFVKTIKLSEYDVLHNIDLISGSFLDYGWISKKIPVVNSVNDYYALASSWNPIKFPYKSSDFLLRYFHYNAVKRFNLKAIRNANRIIANSNSVAEYITKESKVPNDKIDIINRGINYKKFISPVLKDKYTNHNILFIGINMERKGGKYLIYSAPKIIKRHLDTRFIIIGTASKGYLSQIKEFIKKYNIEKNFKFINQVKEEEIPNYHTKANVFVMPSIMEGFGQVFLEAMASQTPVIGTNVGGIPEIITKDVGFLVKPKNSTEISDAINYLFDNPKISKKMGQAAKNRVEEQFTKEVMVKKVLESYNKAIISYNKRV